MSGHTTQREGTGPVSGHGGTSFSHPRSPAAFVPSLFHVDFFLACSGFSR